MENQEIKILLVDDEPDILEFVGYNLKKEGYQIFTSSNGKEAIITAKEIKPHLIILDVMMPEMDGIEACKELRLINSLNETIIVFLTARSEDYSQIAGLEAGADDYIAKPVKPRILISKIKALLRRYGNSENPFPEDILTIGEITIDKERYLILKNDTEIILPKKEFELLLLLSSKPNKVFTREEIFAKVWGNDVIVGDRTIDVHIRKLREKIGIDNLKTVKGVGYKFEL
ncbi:MAG: response regulator transcription factor [Bacteroidetes bacterium]|nr:response regulator transcription factor [Bacteroidota bacterium]